MVRLRSWNNQRSARRFTPGAALEVAHGKEEFDEFDRRFLGRRTDSQHRLIAHERHDVGVGDLLLDFVEQGRRQRRQRRHLGARRAGLGDLAHLLRRVQRHDRVDRKVVPGAEAILAVRIQGGDGVGLEQRPHPVDDVVHVALRAAVDDHRDIAIRQIEDLHLPSAFQRPKHSRQNLQADRRTVLRLHVAEPQMDDLASLRIPPHTVDGIDQQRFLISTRALGHATVAIPPGPSATVRGGLVCLRLTIVTIWKLLTISIEWAAAPDPRPASEARPDTEGIA